MARLIANITKTWLMERIESIDKIRQLTTEVRAKGKGFLTNFYLDVEKHSVWIDKGVVFFLWEGDTCFIVRKKETFWNVYFVSTGLEDLEKGIRMLEIKSENVPLMLDVVGRKDQCGVLVDLLLRCDYDFSTTFVRMMRIPSVDEKRLVSKKVALASIEQVKEVEELLYQFFVDKNEQIPYYEELVSYAKLGHVLACVENDRMLGFLIYEKNPSTSYLRYWFVHPDFRDKKVGSDLMNAFLEQGKDTKRQLFWVRQDNENALNRYKHYGFKEDDMFDYIMTNNKQ